MLEALWRLLNTPPPDLEIPFLHDLVQQTETAFMQWVAQQVVTLISWLSTLLLTTPSVFLESPEFVRVHRLVALLAIAAMLPVLGWIGLRTILGGSLPDDVGGAVGRMICGALSLEIVPVAVRMAINLFNNLSSILLQALPTVTPDQVLHPSGLELGMILFVGMYVFLVMKLVLYYAYRNYALIVLVALSPLMLLLWSLPGQSDRMGRWVREITVLLTTQVVHAIQLVILVAMTVGTSGTAIGFPLLLVQIGGLMFMAKTPTWLADYMQEAPNPLLGVSWRQLAPTKLLKGLHRAFIK